MPNFRLQIPNAHFHKHWHDSASHKGRIVTWFNQAARKHRRREARLAKAQRVFPRPVSGLLRPVVHCQTIRYNSKKRAGKGFTLEELKEAKINKREARSIGVAVDYRRKNRSEESKRENVARLEQYKSNLIVFPKKSNRKKGPTGIDASKDEQAKAEQYIGDVMPIARTKPAVTPYKITDVRPFSFIPCLCCPLSVSLPRFIFPLCSDVTLVQADKSKKVFYTLRVARTDAKMVGKREVRKKKAAEAEAEKKKQTV